MERITDLDLTDIRREFQRARDEADAHATRLTGPSPGANPEVCRYCGKFWRQWAGSQLDGHAKCFVPDWFKAIVREHIERWPLIRYADIASAIGLSVSVIRSWISPMSLRNGGR